MNPEFMKNRLSRCKLFLSQFWWNGCYWWES